MWFCCCTKEKKSTITEPILNDWTGSEENERETRISWHEYPSVNETYSKEEYDRTTDNKQIEKNREANRTRRLFRYVYSNDKKDNIDKDNTNQNQSNTKITYHTFLKSI